MPIFEYYCKECVKPMQKLISLGGFRLKGDGWTT